MSNCEVIELSPIQVQRHQLRQAVKCLTHTILFCRSLGTVRPQPVDCSVLESSFMSCGEPSVASVVEEGARAAERWADKYPGQEAAVWVGFHEKRNAPTWMGNATSRVYWERWVLRLSVVDTPPRVPVAEQLERCIAEVVVSVNTKREHIPPIQQHSSKAALPFHFDVEVPRLDKSLLQSGISTIKRMLMQTTPPPVLT